MRKRSDRRCETALAELYDGWCLPCGFRKPAMLQKNAELFLTRAKLEVEMFQANLEYREAMAGLKALMRQR
jgi:hypothetical protein